MQYHSIPCNTMQYHAIKCNTMQHHAIPCNTMQYNAIPCNTMRYHASLITADGAYHCPVGSIILVLINIDQTCPGVTKSAKEWSKVPGNVQIVLRWCSIRSTWVQCGQHSLLTLWTTLHTTWTMAIRANNTKLCAQNLGVRSMICQCGRLTALFTNGWSSAGGEKSD